MDSFASRVIGIAAITAVLAAPAALAGEMHVINAQARVFAPDIVYIQPGDSVQWVNMTSHDTVSVEGVIPEGAQHWRGGLGENFGTTLDIEGVYAYVCEPHIGFGMVGAIVVGEPVNIDAAMKYAQENLQGPYRRVIGKLLQVQRAAKKE
jgi:pseudoazurin